MSRKFNCLCGREVTGNTLISHVKGIKCNLKDDDRNRIIAIMALKTSYRHAWLKADGVEAVADEHWWKSVILQTKSLEDWTFDPPRLHGHGRPSTYSSHSVSRCGSANPMCRANVPNYDIQELKLFARDSFRLILDSSGSFRSIFKMLEDTYPNYRYMFADIKIESNGKRGFNKENYVIAHILDLDIEDVIAISHKLRGASISKGQLASEKFTSFASKHAAQLISKLRVSKPQRILHQMILSVDPKAVLEKPWKFGNRYKAFDIYSSRIKSVIEMHGRIFHDISKAPLSMIKMVKTNVENDALKRKLVEDLGVGYIEFWDDETDLWFNKIHDLYGEEPCSYETAKNKIDEADRHKSSLRHLSP